MGRVHFLMDGFLSFATLFPECELCLKPGWDCRAWLFFPFFAVIFGSVWELNSGLMPAGTRRCFKQCYKITSCPSSRFATRIQVIWLNMCGRRPSGVCVSVSVDLFQTSTLKLFTSKRESENSFTVFLKVSSSRCWDTTLNNKWVPHFPAQLDWLRVVGLCASVSVSQGADNNSGTFRIVGKRQRSQLMARNLDCVWKRRPPCVGTAANLCSSVPVFVRSHDSSWPLLQPDDELCNY